MMGFRRAGVLSAAAGLSLLAVMFPPQAQAQTWPTRNVTIIVPVGAGGTTDVIARLVAQHLQVKFKSPFIVENKPGAGASLGTAALAKSAPDGYTFGFLSPATHGINGALRTIPYDAEKDFEFVTTITDHPPVLSVRPGLNLKTLPEFIAYAKANPGKLNFGSSGVGSVVHLSTEIFLHTAGIKATHVPYRGSNETLQSMIGGHVDFSLDPLTSAGEFIESKQIVPLAVGSPARLEGLPNVPALAETFPGFNVLTWGALGAPAGTPRAIVDAVNAEIKVFLDLPDTKEKLAKIWAPPHWRTSQDTKAFLMSEMKKWAETVRIAGVKLPN